MDGTKCITFRQWRKNIIIAIIWLIFWQYCDIECMLLIIQRLKLYHTNSLEIEDLPFEMFYNVRDINYTEMYTTWDRIYYFYCAYRSYFCSMSLLCLYIEFHVIHISTIVCAFELHEIPCLFYSKDSNAQSLISFLEQKIFYTNRTSEGYILSIKIIIESYQ